MAEPSALTLPANGPAWLPDFSRSIVRLIMRSTAPVDVTVTNLPDPAVNRGRTIFVSDESGGAVTAYSDGTNWRRSTDRAIVS